MDPHHFDADPNADLDSTSNLMRMRILIFFNADPVLTFHLDVSPDPDLDPSFQRLNKCSNRLKFHTFIFGLSSAN